MAVSARTCSAGPVKSEVPESTATRQPPGGQRRCGSPPTITSAIMISQYTDGASGTQCTGDAISFSETPPKSTIDGASSVAAASSSER